jgi:hypothetical protein
MCGWSIQLTARGGIDATSLRAQARFVVERLKSGRVITIGSNTAVRSGHRAVTSAVAVSLGRLNHPFDLALS